MKKRTTEDIVAKFKEIFVDENYDYSQVIFVDNKKPVKVFCPKDSHGWFEATPRNMIERKKGCPYCGGYTLTADIFVKKAREVHGDFFDYSKVNYVNGKTKVTIGCPVHGDFQIEPNNHTNGKQGCKLCAHDRFRSDYRKDAIQFFEECAKVHNNFYDYTKSVYVNNKKEILITCPLHGDFLQVASSHLTGRGCMTCGLKKLSDIRSQTPENIILRCQEVHGDRYDYSISRPIGMLDKMSIICKSHGKFDQTPAHHIYDQTGCPTCSKTESKWEIEIKDYLSSLGVELRKDKTLINPFEIDIYVPDKKVAFELNGLYFHSENSGKKNVSYHKNKTLKCASLGVDLFHFFDDEWKEKPDIVKSMMKSKLGIISNKVYARKCNIVIVDKDAGKTFLDKNHIQGAVGSIVKLGLEYNNELVSLMTFTTSKEFEWELNRFCNKTDYNIVGSASRLLSYFIKKYNPTKIVSFADLRWSKGDLYKTLGFIDITEEIRPSYFYTNDYIKKFHKRGFQHKMLKDKLETYDPEKSEWENMQLNGWDRVWDCGKLRFLWVKP